jgi:hypothetical protein
MFLMYMKCTVYMCTPSIHPSIHPSIYLYGSLLDLGLFFNFSIFYTVGMASWTGDQPVARPLPAHRTTQTQNKRTQTSMPQVGFEPTISAFEREKAVHAFTRSQSHDHILLSQIRDSPNLEGQVPVFISLRNRVAQLYPQALGSLFVASYHSQGYGGGIRLRLHTGRSQRMNQSLTATTNSRRLYTSSARTAKKTLLPKISPFLRHLFFVARTCLSSGCLAADDFFWFHYSGFQVSCHNRNIGSPDYKSGNLASDRLLINKLERMWREGIMTYLR